MTSRPMASLPKQGSKVFGDHVALDSHKLERYDCLKWIVSCIWIFGAARKWTPCNFGVTFRYVILTNTTISKLSALPSIIPPVWRQKGQSLIKRFSKNYGKTQLLGLHRITIIGCWFRTFPINSFLDSAKKGQNTSTSFFGKTKTAHKTT